VGLWRPRRRWWWWRRRLRRANVRQHPCGGQRVIAADDVGGALGEQEGFGITFNPDETGLDGRLSARYGRRRPADRLRAGRHRTGLPCGPFFELSARPSLIHRFWPRINVNRRQPATSADHRKGLADNVE
jgi:hypothetical protein